MTKSPIRIRARKVKAKPKAPAKTRLRKSLPRRAKTAVYQHQAGAAGWKAASPARTSRAAMLSKCGPACFLQPAQLKYPICDVGTCTVDCRGLLHAEERALQGKGIGKPRAPRVAALAKQLRKDFGCGK